MDSLTRGYKPQDLGAMTRIWNAVVEDGRYFPQDSPMTVPEAEIFFSRQSHTAVAVDGEEVLGLYILHPNNVGRCGHIANASYAVRGDCRGRHIGEALVKDSLTMGAKLGFRVLQFNAVVASNTGAIRLYERLGFTKLGVVPGGFRRDDGVYEDIIPFVITLI